MTSAHNTEPLRQAAGSSTTKKQPATGASKSKAASKAKLPAEPERTAKPAALPKPKVATGLQPAAKPVAKPVLKAQPEPKPGPTAKPVAKPQPKADLPREPEPAAKPAPPPMVPPAARSAPPPMVPPAAKSAPPSIVLPEPGSLRKRGLGLLGQQAMNRATPTLQVLPKPHLPAPPGSVKSPDGLASLIARAGRGGTESLGREHEPIGLLRDELLALLALTEEPSEPTPTS